MTNGITIDASCGKVHASGARGGDQEMSRTKGAQHKIASSGRGPQGMPIQALVTQGTGADCKEADRLINGPLI